MELHDRSHVQRHKDKPGSNPASSVTTDPLNLQDAKPHNVTPCIFVNIRSSQLRRCNQIDKFRVERGFDDADEWVYS